MRHRQKAIVWIFLLVLFYLPLFYVPTCFAKLYGSDLCKTQGYECVRIKRGQSWRSLWPDVHDRDIVMRVNRMNTQLYPGIKVAVPINLSTANILDFSPFPARIDPPQEKMVVIDPLTVAWGAYAADGSLVRWGPASLGGDYCPDIGHQCHTHPGSYRVFSLGSSNCYSRKFPLPDGGAPMPYCMYFNNGQALHGEPNGLPGYNTSHGCVRLYVNDAEWLRYSFIEGPNGSNDFHGTRVVVGDYETPEEVDNDGDTQDSYQDQDASQDSYQDQEGNEY